MFQLNIIILLFLQFITFITSCQGQVTEIQVNKIERKELDITKVYQSNSFISQYIEIDKITRFQPEIIKFLKDDSVQLNRKIEVVFTGSSTIRRWKSLNQDITDFHVLNRGFGGSTLAEVLYYSDILIVKHNPKSLFIYAGENDLACNKCDSSMVIEVFKFLNELIYSKLPETKVYYLSIKPSPARMKFWEKMKYVNNQIETYCKSTTNCTYVEFGNLLFNDNGELKSNLFLADGVHLNQSGYKILKQTVLDALKTQSK